MTAPVNKPISEETKQRFQEYYDRNRGWKSLRTVLIAGLNVKDHHVVACREYAQDHRDLEGEALANILMTMSKSQRIKLSRQVK